MPLDRFLLILLTAGLLSLPVGAAPAAGPASWKTMGERLALLNTRIEADRRRLIEVSDRYLSSDEISEEDFNWLKSTAEAYGLQPRQRGDRNFFNALLARIDVVPPSLALGIGWLESGWRNRRPAACSPPCSPVLAPEDMHGWVHALNTAERYAAFRAARLKLRQQGKPVSAAALAPALEPMTSEGRAYTRRLNAMIQRLRLDRWDPKT